MKDNYDNSPSDLSEDNPQPTSSPTSRRTFLAAGGSLGFGSLILGSRLTNGQATAGRPDNTALSNAADVGAGSQALAESTESEWSPQTRLLASDGDSVDHFGDAAALQGSTAIVGAPNDDTYGSISGSAYVFERDGDGWTQSQKLVPCNVPNGNRFGAAIEIDGNTAIVGASDHDDFGKVYVFERRGGEWTEVAQLTVDDVDGHPQFGATVATDGETIFVGSFGSGQDDLGSTTGAVYVFERDGDWTQTNKILPNIGGGGFGYSLALRDDTLAVGALEDNEENSTESVGSGAVYIFDVEDDPTQLAKVKPKDTDNRDDRLGASVGIAGDMILGGNPFDQDTGSDVTGSVHVIQWIDGEWTQTERLLPDELTTNDNSSFGSRIACDEETAIFGSRRDTNADGVTVGSALVFDRQE